MPTRERALDYLSEVGDAGERATAKFDMARIFASRGVAEQAASYVLEAAPLAGDGVSRSIARIVAQAPSAPNHLSEIEEMITAWEMHRSGELEAFAHRLAEMGKGLTLRTFSETRLAFLREMLDSLGDAEDRITQRLRIGAVLMHLARWEECEEQQRHALAEALEFANSRLVAVASNDLAHLLQNTNRLGEAEPLMLRALEIDTAAFGEHHPAVARDLNNLANLLHDTHRIEEAEPLIRRALEIDEAAFGEQHPSVARDLSNLAGLLLDTNRIQEAEPLMRRALEIDAAAFGEHHPAVAADYGNLASLLQHTNRVDEAEALMQRALEIDIATFGEQHPVIAKDLNNLATLLLDTSRIAEAEPLMRRGLEISVAAFGEHHPTVAIGLNNLASLLQDANRVEEAEAMIRRALEIDEAVFGEHHPNVAFRLNNLATLLQDTNRHGEVETPMLRALEILHAFGRQTGHEHPQLQSAKANYQALRRAVGSDRPD